MSEETSLVKREVSLEPQVSLTSGASLSEVIAILKLVDQALKEVMEEGIDKDYATIPGTPKPTLLQPGAEKLGAIFGLASILDVTKTELRGDHREVSVKCSLVQMRTGKTVGQGVGCCTTLESRYRFRVAPRKATDQLVPKKYWELRNSDPKGAQDLLGGKGYSTTKVDGVWMIAEGTDERVEHDNPADYWNTIEKIAAKRAFVSAIKTATASSGRFAVDLEDGHGDDKGPTEGDSPVSPPSGGIPRSPRGAQREESGDLGQSVRDSVEKEEDELILGAERWEDVSIADVVEQKTAKGATFYVVKTGDGREAGTLIADTANDIAQWDRATLEVKPGRKNGTWVITKAQPVE